MMTALGLGLGLGLSSVIGAIKKWFLSDSYKADSVSPSLILDFANNRYAANSSAKNFSDILTFSRASTATYFDANGVMQTSAADVPRFDYDPVTGVAKGLLVEGARTNNLTYSEDLTAWLAPSGASILANSGVAPNGLTTADKIVEDTAIGYHRVGNSVSITYGTTYAISAYVKYDGRRYFYLRTDFFTSTVNNNIGFDLQSGTVTYAASGWDAGIQSVGNGMYRIYAVATAASTAIKQLYFSLANSPVTSDAIASYAGDGASGIYVWGVQVEAGSFPSSYIPTSGSAVTRAADVAMNTSSNTVKFADWYNQSEGAVYVDFTLPPIGSTNSTQFTVSDGTLNNRIQMFTTSGGSLTSRIVNGGAAYNTGVLSASYNSSHKAAISVGVGSNLGIMALNGSLSTASSPAALPSTATLTYGLYVGGQPTGIGAGGDLFGFIKELRYYPIRVTNSEMQRITT